MMAIVLFRWSRKSCASHTNLESFLWCFQSNPSSSRKSQNASTRMRNSQMVLAGYKFSRALDALTNIAYNKTVGSNRYFHTTQTLNMKLVFQYCWWEHCCFFQANPRHEKLFRILGRVESPVILATGNRLILELREFDSSLPYSGACSLSIIPWYLKVLLEQRKSTKAPTQKFACFENLLTFPWKIKH